MRGLRYSIVVPSRERARWLQARENHTIKFVSHLDPIMYVRNDDSQLEEYRRYADRFKVELMVQDGSQALGAAQTYDSLIEWAIGRGDDVLIILDDDMFFKMHNPIDGEEPFFRKCRPAELACLLDQWAHVVCAEVPAMSLVPLVTRTQPALIKFCKGLGWCYAFYLPHFSGHPRFRFWQGREIEARCDLNLGLDLLTSGYYTAYFASVFIDCLVNNPGGCSTYRSLELERASIEYLKQRYPRFLTTKPKLGWVGDPTAQREAPYVYWQKAFNHVQFVKNFGEAPRAFELRKLNEYESTYMEFVAAIRRGEI